jgi:hypothetical protein
MLNFPGVTALPCAPAGWWTMQLDLDLIFSIRDAASAEFMTVKAACLCNAGVIDIRQRKMVERRAQTFLETAKVLQVIGPGYSIESSPSKLPIILGKRDARCAMPSAA